MFWAKQSTAATYTVGPILDSAGAEYASAVIGDLSISKIGGTLTALASTATLTYIANGQYTLALRTTDAGTLGHAQILCNKSTYQMPTLELMVIPATVFDALVTNATNTTGGLPAATAAIAGLSGTIATTTNITAATGITVATNNDKTGYSLTATTGLGNQTANITGTITTVTTATNVTTVNGLAAGVITAASIAADAITDAKVASDVTIASVTGTVGSVAGNVGGSVASVAGNVSGSVASVVGNVGGNVTGTVGSVVAKTGYALASTGLDLVTAWTTNITGSLSGAVGSVTGNVGGSVASVTGNVGGNVTGSVGSVTGMTASDVGAIKLISDRLATMYVLDGAVYQFTANALELGPSGSGGTSDWTADERTAIRTILGVPASGTTPDVPSAGALKVIDDLIDTEVGTLNTNLNALIVTVGVAGAGLTATDDATLAAIAALNNLSAAQVNAEMDTALVDIHLDHLLAADYNPASKPGVATALLNELIVSDAGVSQFSTNALENAPSGGGGGGAAGSGSTSETLTITVSGQPADGVAVWVSTDIGGSNVVAGTLWTDAFGEVTFLLDPGSYYAWKQKAGVNFTNPEAFTVA